MLRDTNPTSIPLVILSPNCRSAPTPRCSNSDSFPFRLHARRPHRPRLTSPPSPPSAYQKRSKEALSIHPQNQKTQIRENDFIKTKKSLKKYVRFENR
ncbi:MAG: hypothetical protein D6805_05385 [Planctomycetota bacterium]|nr:MAG: hypothetical protein D6805_05385 [Planctomycetota bacterium]